MARETCEDCGLSYRYQADLEEHKRVGCRMKSSDGPTWSDKDVAEAANEIEQSLANAIGQKA